jgi:hypothetical protein
LPPRIVPHIGLPEKGAKNEGPFPGFFGGSTGVGGCSALGSLAAEHLRRTPSRGPSEKGTNPNGSRSCPGDKLRFRKKHRERRKKKAKREGALLYHEKSWGIVIDSPGSSVVAFLYRGRQCGFNTKHQSTKATLRIMHTQVFRTLTWPHY